MVHWSICRSPSELPKAKIGRRPINWLIPTGLPGPSLTKSILGSLTQDGDAVAHFEFGHAAAADHLFGGNAVDSLGEDAHEFDAATGDDKSFEAICGGDK